MPKFLSLGENMVIKIFAQLQFLHYLFVMVQIVCFHFFWTSLNCQTSLKFSNSLKIFNCVFKLQDIFYKHLHVVKHSFSPLLLKCPPFPVILEIGANKRRVVRQIPDEIVNNLELQDAVRQVNNEKLHMTLGSLDPLTP